MTFKSSVFKTSGLGGVGEIVFRGLTGREALSEPYRFDVDVLASNADGTLADVLGRDWSLTISLPGGGQRELNGVVTWATQNRVDDARLDMALRYRLRVEPRLALLKNGFRTRFFYDRTVVKIVDDVLQSHAVDVDMTQLTGSYVALEHCAQYQETDFDFVSRLLEREGIHYFFVHRGGKHTMVLSDGLPNVAAIGKYASVPCRLLSQQGRTHEGMTAWAPAARVTGGVFEVNEYDFEKPSASRQQGLRARATRGAGYDKPAASASAQVQGGGFRDAEGAERRARIDAERALAHHTIWEGRGDLWGVSPGAAFDLTGHPKAAFNNAYRVVWAEYRVEGERYENHGGGAGDVSFDCRLGAIRKNVVFRPLCVTPRPRVSGPQTAFVVGPRVDDVHTDKYGRIRVAFHWECFDRAESDAAQRCWVRVAQGWAGKQWGGLFIPRVGQEVVVEFIDGDPDWPLVTGGVYNAAAMPPYALPDNAAISTLKSRSLASGGGSNELRFNDSAGKEQLFQHAERDMETYVKQDELSWIGRDQHRIVTRDRLEAVDGDRHESVKGDRAVHVCGKESLSATGAIHVKTDAAYALAGATTMHLKAGTDLVLEAGMSITLKAGAAFIVIGPAGVAVSGTPIQLNSGGSAKQGGGSSPSSPKAPLSADDGTKKLA